MGNGAVWEMENREAEPEKMSEKGLQKAYKHSLQPHDLALVRPRSLEIIQKQKLKNEERETERREERWN